MTVQALVGLGALNLAYLCAGVAVLWAIRGFRSWTSLLRLAGLAYLLGVAVFGTMWTELLVLGVPFGGAAIVVSLAVTAVCGLAVGRARRVPVPRGWSPTASTQTLIATAVGAALAGLMLEAYFRAGRLQSLQAYDGWAFWVPKGIAIYLFDGLDQQVFTTTPGPSYPPVVPILDAAAFHAMGSVDPVTLHVQYWFLVAGGLGAIVGCLARHTTPLLLWPPLLLVVTVPRFGTRLLAPQADVLVDMLFVVAALLLTLWVGDRKGWRLACAAILLGGATLTKREGIFFAACALALALVVGARRGAWRPVLAAAAVVILVAAPWRIWCWRMGIDGGAPPADGLEGSADRALDALRLSVDVLFDVSLWSLLPFVVLVGLAVSFASGDRGLAGFAGALLAAVFLGGAWVTFSFRELPVTADEAVNPIVRYTGAVVLLGASLLPLLLASAWRGRSEDRR